MTIVCKSGNSESKDVVFTDPSISEAVVFSNTYTRPPKVVFLDCGVCVDATASSITTTGCNIEMPITMETTVKIFIYENN